MARPISVVELTPEEEAELIRRVRAPTTSARDGVRARGLAGNAASDNAEEVGRLGLLMAERAWELAQASG